MPTHLGDGPQRFASLRRTLIRKTSLLHKIDPTARRSSFADVSIPRNFSHDRLVSMEIPWSSAPLVTFMSRATLGSISSSRCQTSCAPPDQSRARADYVSHERAICSRQPPGGARRDRTDDLLLAKQALSQLSYGPYRSGPPSPKRVEDARKRALGHGGQPSRFEGWLANRSGLAAKVGGPGKI